MDRDAPWVFANSDVRDIDVSVRVNDRNAITETVASPPFET